MMKNIKNILLTAIITVLAGVAIKVFDGSGDAKSDENADGNSQKEGMMSESEKGPDMVTIGGVTFPMSRVVKG